MVDACLCFPAGTPVTTRDGLKPIEQIKAGDEVLSRNRTTGKLEYQKVTALIPPHPSKLLQISVAAEANPLQPTPEHPFFGRRAGGSQAEWIRAVDLQVGDSVLTAAATWTEVLAISALEKEEVVYNFEVEENHDYFVGAAGLLVHNGFCTLDANALIQALDGSASPAVDAAIGSMIPQVSEQALSEYLAQGSADALLNWMASRGGGFRCGPSTLTA